jgi:hypothetical protein
MAVRNGDRMTKKISQREAHRLRKRVKELEHFLTDERSGVLIDSWTLSNEAFAKVETADLLGYSILLRRSYSGTEVRVRARKI